MEDYRERLEGLLVEAYGTADTSAITARISANLLKALDEGRVDFSRVRGSVRLMMGRVMTPKEVEAQRERVLKLKLP